MPSFTWLHITDLHYGLPTQRPLWPNVRHAFLEDLTSIVTVPIQAVLFTGDLTQTGSKEEFDGLDEHVLAPLWRHLEGISSTRPVLLAVPGNHDLVRPNLQKPSAALRQLLREQSFKEIADEFWTEADCEYRKVISTAFLNYSNWWESTSYRGDTSLDPGILPGDFSASLQLTSLPRDLRVGIVGSNTSFLQLAGGEHRGRLACDIRQLHHACGNDLPNWIEKHDATLLLTHHGPEWLNDASRTDSYPEINPAGRFAAHLFGHMHETVLRVTHSGGGRAMRQWQGASLFGMEKHGEPPSIDRRHGYTLGQIVFGPEHNAIRFQPRTAIKDTNGWRFVPDTTSCVLNDDGFTSHDILQSRTKSPAKRLTDSTAVPIVISGNVKRPSAKGDQALRNYREAICESHSHISFVEIPNLKDISDVPFDRLYIDTYLSKREIHPDLPFSGWPRRIDSFEAIRQHSHLTILGDPGSGKSTLTSYLSWQLCRPPQSDNRWAVEFSGYIPLPMILRELHLKADIDLEGLLDSFLQHRTGRHIPSKAFLHGILTHGRAIILLDGLDEIGNLTIRRRLKQAVHSGIATYPKCKWILTSRIVGYDQVPFHYENKIVTHTTDSGDITIKKGKKYERVPMTELLYMSPLDDPQINAFSKNWYTEHEKSPELADISAKSFVQSIRENDGTQRLARIPYLLTLMALIHQKNASLPHGRTELYERIATAYLESIDLRRHLDRSPYSLPQKRRWLAAVAYQMQLRRMARKGDDQILVTKPEILRWLRDSMAESGATDSYKDSDALLKYFAVRSGLLLPRGEGMFAFMHLSLQEYFAACFLEPQLTSSRFATQVKREPSNKKLSAWANTSTWRETLVLLFELYSGKPIRDTEALLEYLFAQRFHDDQLARESNAAGLLAEIVTDPVVPLSADTRRKWRRVCWLWLLGLRVDQKTDNTVLKCLLRESNGDFNHAWKAASISRAELRRARSLNAAGCAQISDISPLEHMTRLEFLNLDNLADAVDLTPLCSLKMLSTLELGGGKNITDIRSLHSLPKLKRLVSESPLEIGQLCNIPSLEELHLHYTIRDIIDITPLAQLGKLRRLCIAPRNNIHIDDSLRANLESINSVGVRVHIQRLSRLRGPKRM